MRTLFLALGLLLAPVMTAGAVSSEERQPLRDRQLKGHTFQLPILQQSAMITTHVGIREGLARYDVPDVPIGANGQRDILLVGVQQTLDVGLRLTDWLALSGFARGTAVIGSTAASLIAQGGSYDLVGQAGLVGRLLRNDSSGTQLSLRAVGGWKKGRDLVLVPFIRAITGNPLLTLDDVLAGNSDEYLLEPNSETSATGGVYLAQALGPSFSLQASAVAEYAWQKREQFDATAGTRLDQDTYAARVYLAAALTADLNPGLGIPIAVMGEYLFLTGRQTSVLFPDRTLAISTVALGVYYSGRPHLQLGLGAVASIKAEPRPGLGPQGQTQESGEPTLSYGQLILRYIF